MKLFAILIAAVVFGGITGTAYLASAQGWGLPGMLEKPVSIRQASTNTSRSGRGPMFLYFGTRSHYGGGFRGGK